jgi:hypothetical protein
MGAGLLTEQGIDTPSTINPDCDTQIFEGQVKINDINRVHISRTRTAIPLKASAVAYSVPAVLSFATIVETA